jgi:tetratricopeptide (TPR) repeat protein
VATNKDKLIAGAQKLVEKGSFDKAIKEYLKVVAEDQSDVRIWLKIGDLYAKLGKRTEATETYQRVAQFYSEQGFYLKSVAVYKQILKIDPRLVEVNQRLAELYKQLGLLSDAMQQYETVAAFFHREGKTREALAALKQIVELDPETVANRIKLAELYSKEQMPREAIDEFTRAAEQLREAGRIDDFMKVAERLLFHSPDNRPVTKELAGLYIEKGDPRRALPKLQVLFKANPRDTDVLGMLARAFEALEQRPKAVSVYKELARILGENGDTKAREDVYRKIAALQPGDAEAEAALGGRPRSQSGPQPQPPPAPTSGLRKVKGGSSRAPVIRDEAPASSPEAAWPSEPTREVTPDQEFEDAPATHGAAPSPMVDPGDTLKPGLSTGADSDDGGDAATSQIEEEIARILNETDVYIKYNLHTKAIEHLQRVFEHSPNHVESREKLKALYLILGKRDEAVLELWALAEHAEPGRQRRYLREILELDPRNARAAELLGEKIDAAVEDIEDLADEEFDIAPPSGLSDAVLATTPRGKSAVTALQPPPRFSAPAHRPDPDEEDVSADVLDAPEEDLIPLVVEPAREASNAEPHDFADGVTHEGGDEDDDRFSLDESTTQRPPAPLPPPPDSEPQVIYDDSSSATAVPAVTREEPAQRKRSPTVPPVAPELPVAAPVSEEVRVESSLEDDLDEADFFIQQALFEEARVILEGLSSRYPNHPLVQAKLRDLNETQSAQTGHTAEATIEPIPDESTPMPIVSADLSAELPTDLPGSGEAQLPEVPSESSAPPVEVTRRGVIERGVNAEDFETHYDLGIAYKEMGLIDDAIAEFRTVMKDPVREVQCHLMVGLCYIEKAMLTDAIGQFKKGLYVEGITDRESLSLYFELGQAYEKLSDPREALYYYDKVQKRDARFRDVEKRISALRGNEPSGVAPVPSGPGDDVDAAFESLLGEDAS